MDKKPFLLILLMLAAPLPAFALENAAQLHFLETFAVREYDRGDTANAAKEFQRILRVDPKNPVALEYLKKLSSLPAAAAPRSIDQVITDIAAVKNSLAEYEKDSSALKSLIRSLMTDNDAMYQILYIRSREVADFRSKFYGTTYDKAYTEAMKGLPIDRVPQHLHRADEILPEEPKALPRGNQDAVDALITELYPKIARKRLVGQVFYAPRTMPAEALDKALLDHRDALIEKTIATAEQHDNLSHLKDELTGINASLKQADSRYALAVKKIDDYYKRIETNIAQKDLVDQRMFNELVADYAAKVNEFEELKKAIRRQDTAVIARRPVLAAAHERIQAIERAKPNDAELSQLKAELTSYKDFLARQEVRNTATEDAVARTAAHVTELEQQLTDIAKDLAKPEVSAVDKEKKALEIKTAALETKLKGTAKDLDATNTRLNNLTIREQGLVKELDGLRPTAAQANEVTNENARLKQSLLETRTRIAGMAKDLEEKTALVKALRDKAAPYEQRIAELSQEVATLSSNERCLHPVHDINKPSDDRASSELNARLRRAEEELTGSETRLTRAQTEIADLREKLARRDTAAAELKANTPPPGQAELCALSLDTTEKDTRINELQNQLLAVQQTIKDLTENLKNCAPPNKAP